MLMREGGGFSVVGDSCGLMDGWDGMGEKLRFF